MPDLTLPFADTESSDESLFSITNTGKGGGVRAITKGPGAAAVFESDTGAGVAVICEHGTGVFSESHEDIGVTGDGKKGGVRGTSVTIGVKGECNLLSPAPANIGVWGDCPNSGSGTGVLGTSNGGIGVQGKSVGDSAMGFLGGRDPLFHGAVGVYGESVQNGVFGRTASKAPADHAVYGQNDGAGHGVTGVSTISRSTGFLAGRDPIFHGAVGVYGESAQNGVFGRTASSVPEDNAVYGQNDGAGHGVAGVSRNGIGVFGTSTAGLAAKFKGDVEVTGDIRLTNGNDCAEEFDVVCAHDIEPGTVMVISEDGMLQQSEHGYDKKVAGVVSGAGDYRPGIVLGKHEALADRLPIALLGKVYCKVDARFSPIEVGDLLTTSPTRGHAMKADCPAQAFGALIGKALRPLREGQGMIPILVALQ